MLQWKYYFGVKKGWIDDWCCIYQILFLNLHLWEWRMGKGEWMKVERRMAMLLQRDEVDYLVG